MKEPDFSHFNIYKKKEGEENFVKINTNPVLVTGYEDGFNLEKNILYSFAVTAVDTNENESEFSNIVITKISY